MKRHRRRGKKEKVEREWRGEKRQEMESKSYGREETTGEKMRGEGKRTEKRKGE